MVTDEGNSIKFTVRHHYEKSVKAAGDIKNPTRIRRLAQEAVTLSTSLPLSVSSCVFVRCDEERLDIMKVNINKSVIDIKLCLNISECSLTILQCLNSESSVALFLGPVSYEVLLMKLITISYFC